MRNDPYPRRIAGAILAGGQARRLDGIPKGTLLVEGVPFVKHQIDQLRAVGIGDITIVTNEPSAYREHTVDLISDIHIGIGPMGGIEAALSHFAGQADGLLVVPCDLPYIASPQFATLIEAFLASDSAAVFAQTGPHGWHPLCAVMDNRLRTTVSIAIKHGERKIRNLWRHIGALPINFPDERPFFNVNCRADIERLHCSEQDKIAS
ncbi:molybdenum cofactor guanylyltransferase [Planctomycetota bacterium]